MKISYSFGIVDLLHYGHINALRKAKEGSDLHLFGLISDKVANSWMGNIVSNYDERKAVLEHLNLVDKVMFQDTLDPLENVKLLHKKYPAATITLYHGDNWKVIPAEKYLSKIGGSVVFTEYYEKLKPENILRLLNERKKTTDRIPDIISTKANTLEALKKRLNKSHIEEILTVTVGEYKESLEDTFELIKNTFNGKKIVLRSSSSNEDMEESSNAGHYESVLNVDSKNPNEVHDAMKVVIDSYIADELFNDSEQILIQTQTQDVMVSGVLFNRDIHHNRPYYLINYDDTGSTDSVTSGAGGKTIWISHDTMKIEEPWSLLIDSVREIESMLNNMVLDIEFAITNDNKVVIFQVRPLAANYKFNSEITDKDLFKLKTNTVNEYNNIENKVFEKKMLLSDMAFWNPSEIIGSNPRNLDYSLYREIITKQPWNDGLVPMGYKKVPHDLMYKLGNKPYISVDYSFMSLIPEELDIETSLKLLEYYRKKLLKDLTAHDKIEFEIVYNVFDFETKEKLEKLYNHGFSYLEISEIEKSLFNLTNNSLNMFFKTLKDDEKDLDTLNTNRVIVENYLLTKKYNVYELVKHFKTLLHELTVYGTAQFSRQARYAFMSRSFSKTLVNKGYFTEDVMDNFMLSINTVASDFEKDFDDYLNKKLSKKDFNNRYGHLRSGTYDIRTDRYDQIHFEQVPSKVIKEEKNKDEAVLDLNIIEQALSDIGFEVKPNEFIEILKTSIEQREYFKFEFTKSLSLAIELIRLIGENVGIERNELSYLEVPDILSIVNYDSIDKVKEFLEMIINQRKLKFVDNSKLVLPEIVLEENDIYIIKISESRPNFITQKVISGEVVLLEDDSKADIESKIVVISQADPGFDWIFARNIKGLITKYGGVASHMAIRCAEFGIPAAIGCGEKIYNYVSELKEIELDCIKETIKEIR